MTSKTLAHPENKLFTHSVTLTYEDVNDTAGTTKTVAIHPESGTLSAGTVLHACGYKVNTDFDGGGTTDLTIQVGDGDDTDRYLAAASVHEDGTENDYGISTLDVTIAESVSAADTIDVLFTSSTANLDALTSGSVTIYLGVTNLDALPT